jgi:hypothetical protein
MIPGVTWFMPIWAVETMPQRIFRSTIIPSLRCAFLYPAFGD